MVSKKEVTEKATQYKVIPLVQETQKRLSSLGLSSKVVDYYLRWAYKQALTSDNQLDFSRYEHFLNRLPNISSNELLINPDEQFEDDQESKVVEMKEDRLENKTVKQMSLQETVDFLSSLIAGTQSSLIEEEIVYFHGLMTLDDGYEIPVRIMDTVKINELGESLGLREDVDNPDQHGVIYNHKTTSITLTPLQANEPLGEILEADQDELIYIYRDSHRISIKFDSTENLLYYPIETLKSETI